MYTVDRIEDNYVVIENRDTKEVFNILKSDLPFNIKEGDILDKCDDKYYINEEETKRIKNDIRSRFNSLIG